LLVFSFNYLGLAGQSGRQNSLKPIEVPSTIVTKKDTIPSKPERLVIQNKGRRVVEMTDSTQIQYFYEKVRAVQDSTYFFADSAILSNSYLIAQSNVVVLQDDTIQLFADSLFYSIDSSILEFYNRVIFNNGDQSLASNKIFYDLKDKIAYYQDTATLSRGPSKLQSIRGWYDVENKVSYFYNQVLVRDEEVRMQTDSMLFYTDENKIVFISPTRISTKDAEIYCEAGFYNLETKQGEFASNAQYVSETRIVTGEKLIYNNLENSIQVEGESEFVTDNGKGKAEYIAFYEDSGDLILEGEATYKTDRRQIDGVKITYNEKIGDLVIAGEGRMQEEETIIDAENIEFNDRTGIGYAEGNVIWRDTSNHTKVESDVLNINTVMNASRAYNYNGKPEIEIEVDGDTMFMTSDTLYSFEFIDTLGNKNQFVIGDNNVKIMKSDMQASSDSVVFYVTDSIYSLYDNPVIWSDSTQFTADTIHLYLKNRKIYKMRMIQNAMVINTNNGKLFNQIKGKLITAYFNENELDNFEVDGNAQSVYYVLDEEEAFVGVNTTECSKLKFYFGDNEISDIKGYIEVKQKMIPMDKADHEALRLVGFKWLIEQRPITKNDLQL
jgi:lipopolysaccharide export system protein LptA